jgi:hypothetical protein
MVGLDKPAAVHVNLVVSNGDRIAGHTDDTLDEVAIRLPSRNCLEHHDIPALGTLEVVINLVDEDILAVVQVGKHGLALDPEILHGDTNQEKNRDGQDRRFYQFTDE